MFFLLSRDSSFILSHLNLLVNNFFKFFYFSFFKLLCRSQRNLYYHVFSKVSTPFFEIFSNNLYNLNYLEKNKIVIDIFQPLSANYGPIPRILPAVLFVNYVLLHQLQKMLPEGNHQLISRDLHSQHNYPVDHR